MRKIPVVICIDVEPDERLIDPGVRSDWSGFQLTHEFFRKLRPRLEAATGSPVHFSWFLRMDPQIASTYGSSSWVVTRYGSLIENIKRAGDGIGLHMHAWRWDDSLNEWRADFASQDWVEFCVRMGFESFSKSLDERCSYFRFGDRWMNNETVRLIENLGARFDLTMEPGQTVAGIDEPFSGSFLDCSQVPQRPYRPSITDFRRPGKYLRRGLWIIPLSVGPADWPASSASQAKPEAVSGNLSREAGSELPAIPGSVHHPSTGSFEGYLDRADCEFISGWAYDKDRPETRIDVDILEGDRRLTTATAATFRQDLLAAAKGDGRHSFSVPTPSWLKDGKPHLIQVKVAGNGFYLNNSPIELCSFETIGPPHLTMNLSDNSWSMCRIFDTLLSNPDCLYLALVVRSDVSIYSDLQSHLDQTINHILSHPLIGQLVFETPGQMIRRVR